MIISQTPLRISLCGGGTDFRDYYLYNTGFVLSTAIDKFVYVFVKDRYDDKIYIDYAQKEIVDDISEIKHELVREAAKMTNMNKGFEVAMFADIPSEGSGLGSSSSLTVGLLNAFYNFQGKQVTAEILARQACEIEIDILNKPIGKQDQYIAAYGGLVTIQFNKDDSVELTKMNLDNGLIRKLGSNLLLFFTNVTRKSSNILTEQKANITSKVEFHDKIKTLAYEAVQSLESGNLDKLGEIIAENWRLKKHLASNITNGEIDEMYERSLKGGALGGKIAGAGGGGFLLSYCTRDRQDSLRTSMNVYREMPFLLEPHGSKIIFDYQRYNWK